MDPVSIVTSIGSVGGTVFKVSTRLYSFIKATKSVDKSIEALYDEVKRLEAVLTTAEATLTETAMKHTKDPTLAIKGLWTSIENGVQDCRVTVEALDGLVQDVGTVTGTNNLFEKTFRQLKLNLSTDEITAVRGRIHNHTICLQLALEMLSVYVYDTGLSSPMLKQFKMPELLVSKQHHRRGHSRAGCNHFKA